MVEPFIAMLRDATENARQIERLRRDLNEAKRRRALANCALATLKPMRDIAVAPDLIETLDERRVLWEGRANAESDLAGALKQQLDDRLSDRGATQTAAGEAASSFVKDRGISLLLGLAAFAIVFGTMRLVHRIARWLRVRWKIRRNFYTDLVNPALEGAEFTLPIKDLIGLYSRPSGPDEPWFPSLRGDWVRLADEVFGQVISQSPDMVELEIPGGSRVTYTHDDYLAEKPDNLSGGFRSEIEFGLSYNHQDIATGKAMEMLKDHIREGLLKLVPEQHLLDVGCEMLEAGDNAIIYEVEADLTGAVALLMEDVERELTRLCVDECNKFGWEIPFPQLVVHKP